MLVTNSRSFATANFIHIIFCIFSRNDSLIVFETTQEKSKVYFFFMFLINDRETEILYHNW